MKTLEKTVISGIVRLALVCSVVFSIGVSLAHAESSSATTRRVVVDLAQPNVMDGSETSKMSTNMAQAKGKENQLRSSGEASGIFLESVTGLETGYLQTGAPITFHLRVTNSTDLWLTSISNGFQVYSPNGAKWTTTVGDTTEAFGAAYFDFFQISGFSTDGSGEDTIGFGGWAYEGGLPPGFDEVAYKITIGPIDPKYGGDTICLDSTTYYPPEQVWLWSSYDTALYPEWDGPHCFPVKKCFIAVTSPGGGDKWTVGSTYEMKWSSDCDCAVRIEYSTNGGGSWITIQNSTDNDGSYWWNVSDAPSTNCLVRVCCLDGTTCGVSGRFSIVQPNRPPEFVDTCRDTVLEEGQTFNCQIVVTDPDNDPITIDWNQTPNTASATFTDNGDGTAAFSFTPDYRHVDQKDTVIFEASDSLTSVADSLVIGVVNRQLRVENFQPQPGEDQDILISHKPFQIQFNEALQQSSLNGNVYTKSKRGDRLTGDSSTYDPVHYFLFIDNDSDYLMTLDIIEIVLDTGILDSAGHRLDQKYVDTFYTGVTVFPGDANNDGIVDERDVLPLGLYWGNQGPFRATNPDLSPKEIPAHVFVASLRWTPLASVYADADGSGTIDANDICGVANNWAQTHFGERAPQDGRVEIATALKQVEENVLQQMYKALIDCPESEGKQIVMKMFGSLLGEEPAENVPTTYELYQNYPNPFNPYTSITFYLPQSGHVTLSVYNIMGQKVAVLLDGYMDKGYGETIWEGLDQSGRPVASGMYFYRLESNELTFTKRMMLLR